MSQSDSVRAPISPKHPGPDSEVDVSEVKQSHIPHQLERALELDNDSSDDEEKDADMGEEDEEGDTEDAVFEDVDVNPLIESVPGFVSDFYDFDASTRNTPVNPFHDSERHSARTLRPFQVPGRRLSMSQQSKLVTYIDEQLLSIQRQFIKYLSTREDSDDSDPDTADVKQEEQEEPASSYSLSLLCQDLHDVITMIYFSIFQSKEVPVVAHANLLGDSPDRVVEIPRVDASQTFGQSEYLIKIMGDLVDYILKFHIGGLRELDELLRFMASFDNVLAVLVYQGTDFDDDSEIKEEEEQKQRSTAPQIISDTAIVRMTSVAMRTRMLLVTKFDELREHLQQATDERHLEHLYQELIGEAYEGFLSAADG